MPILRTRSIKKSARLKGSVTHNGTTTLIDHPDPGIEQCTDVVHAYPFIDAGPLNIIKRDVKACSVSGSTKYGTPSHYQHHIYKMYPVVATAEQQGGVHKSDQWLENAALASANPNNPVVDVPNAIYELREVVSLLKALRSTAIRDLLKQELDFVKSGFDKRLNISRLNKPDNNLDPNLVDLEKVDPRNVYLAGAFWLVPLFNDIAAIIDLQNQMANRARKHESGTEVGGLLYQSTSATKAVRTDTFGPYIGRFTFEGEREHKAWYQIKYRSAVDLSALSSKAAQLGLSQPIASIWNSIPWSFLIDYFVNMEHVIRAHEGKRQFEAGVLCVMTSRHSDLKLTKDEFIPWWGFWKEKKLTVSGGDSKFTTKRRVVYHNPRAKPVFDPILAKGQITNLAALTSGLRRYYK